MKFIQWIAKSRLNYFDVLVISIANAALADGMVLTALALLFVGLFASVAIERIARNA